MRSKKGRKSSFLKKILIATALAAGAGAGAYYYRKSKKAEGEDVEAVVLNKENLGKFYKKLSSAYLGTKEGGKLTSLIDEFNKDPNAVPKKDIHKMLLFIHPDKIKTRTDLSKEDADALTQIATILLDKRRGFGRRSRSIRRRRSRSRSKRRRSRSKRRRSRSKRRRRRSRN